LLRIWWLGEKPSLLSPCRKRQPSLTHEILIVTFPSVKPLVEPSRLKLRSAIIAVPYTKHFHSHKLPKVMVLLFTLVLPGSFIAPDSLIHFTPYYELFCPKS
jgi:hypothetical protein